MVICIVLTCSKPTNNLITSSGQNVRNPPQFTASFCCFLNVLYYLLLPVRVFMKSLMHHLLNGLGTPDMRSNYPLYPM